MRARHAQLWAVVVALVAMGCASSQPSPSAALASTGGMKAAPTPATAARSAFDQYVRAFWSEGDTTALLRGISPTMIYHYNGRPGSADPQGHQRSLRTFRKLFPDLTAVIDVYTDSGEYGAAVTTWTGTYQGPVCRKPIAGQQVSWSVNYVFRVADSRIVELWETWDEGGFYEEKLGIPVGKCDVTGMPPAV